MNEQKIARWQALVDASPDDELARFTLARAHLEAGQLEHACTHFRAAIDRKPDWMMAFILLGRCLVELGQHADARRVLDQARALALAQGHNDPLIEIDELLQEIDA